MTKVFNLKKDLNKILPLLLKKIKKEMKVEDIDNEQIKKIQAYTKLLEQINKMLKFVEPETIVEISDQDNRIMESYLKFNAEKNLKKN